MTTTAGALQFQIPKLRRGSLFTSLLDRRRRVHRALFAVVLEASLHGVSSRKVGAFTGGDLSTIAFPHVFLDGTHCRARGNHRVVPQAMVVAAGVVADARHEVLGFDVADTENEALWTQFLCSLKARGLGGVQLVMSDAHTDLKKAISAVLQSARWQRCRGHCMRNVLDVVPKDTQGMVTSIIRTIFAQLDAEHVRAPIDEVARILTRSHPNVALLPDDAKEDLRAFTGFPIKYRRQNGSINPPARVNTEVEMIAA